MLRDDAVYTVKKIGKPDISKQCMVASVLNECGKDMAKKYGLHHWDNPYIKSLLIVGLGVLKNDVFLVYEEEKVVATFMTKKKGDSLHFEKLGTVPSESGKGIGSYCMSKIEQMAQKSGCKRVVMEVYEPSKHAISFYEHRGYRTVGTTETLKYKEIKMEKNI